MIRVVNAYGWIEPVVTLAAALAASVLGTLGPRNPLAVSSATLGVLSLLSLNFAKDRVRLMRIEQRLLERKNGDDDADPSGLQHGLRLASDADLRLDLRGAHEVRLMGVTLNRTLRRHLIELERFVSSGGCVKIALIDPAGPGPTEAARRSAIPAEQRVFEHRLTPTLGLIERLAQAPRNGGRLEVRLLDFVPAFGLAITLTEDRDARIAVELYSHRTAGSETVVCLRRSCDTELFRHFAEEFRQVWIAGRMPGPGGQRPREPKSYAESKSCMASTSC